MSIVDERLEQIKEEFEREVDACIEESKRLTCNFDETQKSLKPWTCRVCSCVKGEYTDCKDINPVKYILSIYPDKLDKSLIGINRRVSKKVKLYLPPNTKIKGPHNSTDMDFISCGNKKDHTLKLTQLGHAKLINFPEGVPLTAEWKGQSYINGRLWAKKVLSNNPWDMKEELLKKLENMDTSLLAINGEKLEYVYNPDDLNSSTPIFEVFPIWKDDWMEDFKVEDAKELFTTMEQTAPPKYWGMLEAMREWLANADDVTLPDGKIRFYKDEHNNVVLDYDSSDERVLSFNHLLVVGKHEEKIHEDSHGMYGEGIKLADIIFMNHNNWMKIEAVGTTYYPFWKYNPDFKTIFPYCYGIPNNRKHGTKITILNVDNPDELIENTKKLFLKYRDDYTIFFEDDMGNKIISPYNDDMNKTRCLSINGQRSQIIEPVGERPQFYFNYNFRISDEKERQDIWGRDRRLTDPSKILPRIRDLLAKLNDEYLIREILEQYSKNVERLPDDLSDFSPYSIEYEEQDLWKKVIGDILEDDIKKYGIDRIAIGSTGEMQDIRSKNLEGLGYRILNWGETGNRFLRLFGINRANDLTAFPESIGKPNPLDYDSLSEKQKYVFNEAKKNLGFILKEYYHESEDFINQTISDKTYGEFGGITVAESFQNCTEAQSGIKINGMYRPTPINQIFIHQNALETGDSETNDEISYATGILLHEFIHGKFGVADERREFENLLTNISGHAGSRWAQIQTALKDEYVKTNTMMPWVPQSVKHSIMLEKTGDDLVDFLKDRIFGKNSYAIGDFVEIIDMHQEDGYYPVKERFIGKVGKLISEPQRGVERGVFEKQPWYLAEIDFGDDRVVSFSYVKINPVNPKTFPTFPFDLFPIDSIDGRVRCWQCKDEVAISKTFPKYPNPNDTEVSIECGKGTAYDYPFKSKPNCKSGDVPPL